MAMRKIEKPSRSLLKNVNWFSAYIASTSSQINEGVLPLPTIPEAVAEQYSLNTGDQQIIARSAPIVSYSNTNARTVSFSFVVADDYMPTKGEGGAQYTIVEYINALKSLVYPRYTSNEVISPQCILNIGNIKLKGIVTSVSVNWKGPLSNILAEGCFSRADIAIQFKEVSNVVKGSITIKNGSDK